MLFCAGLGSRLYPITKDIPKALAPLNNETLLSYNLKFLAAQGVDHFVINLHHFGEKIKDYLSKHNNFALNISFSEEVDLLDTAGGLAKAYALFKPGSDPILLYNVDVVSNINLNSFYKYHIEKKAAISLAVRERKTSRYLLFDDQDQLFGWLNKNTGEKRLKPNSPDFGFEKAFSGIHLINPGVLAALDPERKYSLTHFYLEQMERFRINAFSHDTDYWFDCGKPETLKAAAEFLGSQK